MSLDIKILRKHRVIDWISWDEAKDKKTSVGGWGGFFKEGMRWDDYYDKDAKAASYVIALRDNIVKNKIRYTGEQHQRDPKGIPLFEDGTVGVFSFRAWGDLMAAIWSEEEDEDYSYMDFYM